ncbi:DNA-directed RNA polymerase III subunit RPC9 [Fasciola hepatica]|uniref:DNA-directed RNA polymerase III subunit RPC9 n=1 Tax=Fasciola hepatica TaxID=6192 RepID=A0A4E0RY98_FASHE|nr:DNA-directed RNA polymerase III subunit RPC9 [Fasciola hepatica]
MEVDRNVKLLTNFEILQLINSRLGSKKKIRTQQTLLYTTSKYLNNKSPCAAITPDAIHAFSKATRPFQLSKVELLMLINHCPSTQVELSVIVADLDSRLSTTQCEQLLELVAEHFPGGVSLSQTINTSGLAHGDEDT